MRELVGGKNTIGRTAAVLKKPHKATFTFYLRQMNFTDPNYICPYFTATLTE